MLYISFKQVKNRESLFFFKDIGKSSAPNILRQKYLVHRCSTSLSLLEEMENELLARTQMLVFLLCVWKKRFSSSLPQLLFQLEHFRCQCGTHTISFSSLQRLECRSVKNNLSLFSYWNSWGGKNLGEEHFSFPCFGIITVSRYETSKKVVRGHRRSCALQNPLD